VIEADDVYAIGLVLLVAAFGVVVGLRVLWRTDVERPVKRALSIALGLCVAPFLLMAVTMVARSVVRFDIGAPVFVIVFVLAPLGVVAGNVFALVGVARGWRSDAWGLCVGVLLTTAGYLVVVLLALSDVKM
jgi:hypothetical protein